MGVLFSKSCDLAVITLWIIQYSPCSCCYSARRNHFKGSRNLCPVSEVHGKEKKEGGTPPPSIVFLNIVSLSWCLCSHHTITAHSPQWDTALFCLRRHSGICTHGFTIYYCPDAELAWPHFCCFVCTVLAGGSVSSSVSPQYLRPLGWSPSPWHCPTFMMLLGCLSQQSSQHQLKGDSAPLGPAVLLIQLFF